MLSLFIFKTTSYHWFYLCYQIFTMSSISLGHISLSTNFYSLEGGLLLTTVPKPLVKVRRLPSHKFLSKTESCFIIYHFLQACSLPNFLILLIAPALSPTLRIVLDSSFSLTPFSLTRFHDQPMSKTSRSHILLLWDDEVIVLGKAQKVWERNFKR